MSIRPALALAVVLFALLPGCEPSRSVAPVDRAWLEALPEEQYDDLMRPVTQWWSGRHRMGFESRTWMFDSTVDTGRPGNLVLAGTPETGGELPVELTIHVEPAGRPEAPKGDALVEIAYHIFDFYGRAVADGRLPEMALPAGGSATRKVVLDDLAEPGYYDFILTLRCGGKVQHGFYGFAIVRPNREPPERRWFVCPGTEKAAPVGRRIGCNVAMMRDLVSGGRGVTNLAERSPAQPWTPRFDPSVFDASLESFRAAGLAVFGHVGHLVDFGDVGPTNTPNVLAGLPPPKARWSLPADLREFVAATAPLAAMLTAVDNWDILPDELERLDATPEELRAYLAAMSSTIRERRRGLVMLWVSGSSTAINDYLTAPGMTGLVDAVRLTDAGPLDECYNERNKPAVGASVARRAGAGRWLAVLWRKGYMPPVPAVFELIQATATVLAAGGDVEFGEEIIRDRPCAAGLSQFIAMVGDGAPRGEVWPEAPGLHGPIFDGRGRRVAVLWAATGYDLIDIPEARSIEAFDVMGHPAGIWRERSLILPLGMGPIYITSASLSADDLRRRLRASHIVGLAPNVRIGTITGPVGPRATIPVELVGASPEAADVEVSIEGPPGWKAERATKTVRVEPGKLTRVEFTFRDAARNVDNVYPAEAHVVGRDGDSWAKGPARQAVAVAMTPAIDGKLDKWQAAPPMSLVLPWLRDKSADDGVNVAANAPSASNAARVRAAWDDEFLYLSAEVPIREPLKRERTVEPTGRSDQGNPWGEGALGIVLSPADGDVEREYVLSIIPTATRPAVVRLHAPGMERRRPLPGLPVEGFGEIDGSRAAIVEDGGRAIYEAAIPRRELAALPWGEGRRWRFAFHLTGPADPRRMSVGEQIDWPGTWDRLSRSALPAYPVAGPRFILDTVELGLVRAAGGER